MEEPLPGSHRLKDGDEMIAEINHFIHAILDTEWMIEEWQKLELGADPDDVHPLVAIAFKAHEQIQEFTLKGNFGMTEEIFEVTELAIKINKLKKDTIKGLEKRLQNLTSRDFTLYRTARYEIQVAGMLLERGHTVNFIEECDKKTPDILVSNSDDKCEVECKHKDPGVDHINYIRSMSNNIQTARKQFSKTCPGIIMIEIDKVRFKDFELEIGRLKEEIFHAMRNSSSISAILVTSKVFMEDNGDYVYRHLVKGFFSPDPRHPMPDWLSKNLININ